MHYVGIGVTAVVPASGSDDCGGGVSPWTSRGTRPVIVRNCALRGATCADSNAAVGARCSALIDSLASPDAVATDTAVLDAIAKAISSVDVSAPRTSLGRTSPRFLRTAASWACLRMRAHEPAGARERASDTKMMLSNSQSVRQSGEGAWSVWAMESYDTTYSGPTDPGDPQWGSGGGGGGGHPLPQGYRGSKQCIHVCSLFGVASGSDGASPPREGKIHPYAGPCFGH